MTERAAIHSQQKPRETLGLSGRDYCDPEIFALERERVFFRNWFCVGREQQLDRDGDFFTVNLAGESILVTRARAGALHAFYNVCQHRGARLCEEAHGHAGQTLVCPYHAWSYGLDGKLLHTAKVSDASDIDREARGLRPVALDTWEGFIFVNLADNPRPLLDQLASDPGQPLGYERYRVGELRLAHRIVYEVEANWKVLHDNYNECLHCPVVHPELSKIVPLYQSGRVVDEARTDGGVLLAEGLSTFTRSGRSSLPELPGLTELDRRTYYGYSTFPNLQGNLLSTGVMTYTLYPRSADHTTIVSEYLFRPETIASEGFDCSDMVEFLDLVSVQDWEVCERVQRGVSSRGFDRCVYPSEDGLLRKFAQHYQTQLDTPDG